MNKLNNAVKDNISEMYLNGKTSTEISKYYNVSKTTICRILNKFNIKRNRYLIINKLNINQQNQICKLYGCQKTINEISEILKIKRNWIIKILGLNNIKLRDNSWEAKKYKVNRDYFNEINSEDRAYFLGLIYSDGNLFKNKLSITLIESDKQILDAFAKKIFVNEYKLYYCELNKKNVNHNNTYTVVVSDKVVVDKLKNKYGLCENKTHSIVFPTYFDSDVLIWDFIRGYFDGDGSISIVKDKRAVISIVCNNIFANELSAFLNKNEILSYIYAKNNQISEIKISKKESINKLYLKFYGNSKYFLERKKNKFDYFQNNQIKSIKYSKHIGVTYDKSRNNWKSYGYLNNKIVNLGRFDTEEKAYIKRKEYEKIKIGSGN